MNEYRSAIFRQFLAESKDQLDISIQAAGKYLNSGKRIDEFLSSTAVVEHKTDGVKLTIIKKSNNGDINDFIFAYKGNVLYPVEFDYQPNTKVEKESVGASQFKKVFQHFSKIGRTSIPVGTELFVEFLMRKPTLSSNYSQKHKMVLIGYSRSSWEEKFGKLKTRNSGMLTEKRDSIAKDIGIDTPQVLFEGIMGTEKQFENGIKHPDLKKEFEKTRLSMSWETPEILLDDIRGLFLSIDSKYGGKEEGVVIKYDDKILKFQQEYQLDQEARSAIKGQYREDTKEAEGDYWKNVTRVAMEIANSFTVKNRPLSDLMEELSGVMKRLKLDFEHSKKAPSMIKDDIQLTAKTQIIKNMSGNNNALVLGKFRVFTKEGHYKLISRALKLYDNVVVTIVTGKDTKQTKDLREEMVRKAFPGVEIIHSSSGSLSRILQTSPVNINVVYAGSDRVSTYQEQLKNSLGVSVRELPRNDSDISASEVIAKIDDESFFKKSTPKEIHGMYDEIKKTYLD